MYRCTVVPASRSTRVWYPICSGAYLCGGSGFEVTEVREGGQVWRDERLRTEAMQ